MKSKFFATLVFVTLATLSLAADVAGKWTAEMPGRDGQTRTTTFTFVVDGEKVTGTVSGMQGETPLMDVAVTGDEVSFNVVRSRNGNEMKIMYKGKVEGDVMKLTVNREGAEGPGQQIEAKRAK